MKNGYELIHPITESTHTGFTQTGEKLYQSHTEGGLTKREYFAGLAMQGLLSANPKHTHGNIELPIPIVIATLSVDFADALLKQLEKK